MTDNPIEITQSDHVRAAEIMKQFERLGTKMSGRGDYQLLLRELACHRQLRNEILAALRSQPAGGEAETDYRCHHCKRITTASAEPEQCVHCHCRAFSALAAPSTSTGERALEEAAKALAPFAGAAKWGDTDCRVMGPAMFKDLPDDYVIFKPSPGFPPIKWGHLRAAAIALANLKPKPSQEAG